MNQLATTGQIKNIQRLIWELELDKEEVLAEFDAEDLNCLTKGEAHQLIVELKEEAGEDMELDDFEKEVDGV